jgi:nitrogen-specific signal transduction histidine kinase
MNESANTTYAALDLVPAQICVLNCNGDIQFTNKAWIDFAQANGYAGSDFSHINYVNVCACATGVEAESAGSFARRLKSMLAGGAKETFSIVYPCHAPTQKRWFKGTAFALDDGAVISHTDITEEYRRLEAESRVLSSTGIIHDLRSPLNAVIGYADLSFDLVNDAAKAELLTDSLQQIRQAGLRMLRLVNDLLDYSQELHANNEAKETPIDIQKTIKEITSQTHPIARKLKVFLSHVEPKNLKLLCDEHSIWKMLLNIVTNAVKYNKIGGHVSIYVDSNASGGIEICVQDTGIGMQPDRLSDMFAPFSRSDAARTTLPMEGSGIGLALVREIVVRHDGMIRVSSAVNVGTSITVVFPSWRTVSDTEKSADSDQRPPTVSISAVAGVNA